MNANKMVGVLVMLQVVHITHASLQNILGKIFSAAVSKYVMFVQQFCRAGSSRASQAEADLSPDVSKISFRILTAGRNWTGQRGPCSPLTPIVDSPSSPLHCCRYACNQMGLMVQDQVSVLIPA